MNTACVAQQALYELRFPPLPPNRSGLHFPCSASGEVPLNSLSERVRNNYFLARLGIGRDFSRPRVEPLLPATAHVGAALAEQPHEAYRGMGPRPTAKD